MNLPGRIVVLGGYGHFGARISRALVEHGRAEVCIAGRRLERARCLAAELERTYTGCRVGAVELDIDDPRFVRRLGSIAPIVVIHAAGPFQRRGYEVAEACLACRSHYVDLADARSFVTGFADLDRAAGRRDVLMVTGASTLPGLTSAVVDALTRDFAAVESIETAIVPANRTARGRATLAAVLEYCGNRVITLEDGTWTERTGWLSRRIVQFDDGAWPTAVCDVPDLDLFPARHPGIRTVTFHAGPELVWQHRVLRLMAMLRKLGVVGTWSSAAAWLEGVDARTRHLGTGTGRMQVRVTGRTLATGAAIARSWNLVAHRNHGPEIPCAPAVALAKRMLSGEIAERGAMPCMGLLDLDDIARELEPFDIRWQVEEECLP